jgi:oxygen-independent coproporphyrinogen-3 oxidase
MNGPLPLPIANAPSDSEYNPGPYVSYAYSYPHKSAYGPLDPPELLESLWQAECRDALFLYLHVPFCEMRCGFCNLFTRAGGDDALVEAYLDALERQAHVLADATRGDRTVARFAIGGGTPTFLTAPQIERLFHLAEHHFDVSPQSIPTSIEVSPKTATEDRLQVIRERGVERVSIGVQSFRDEEAHAIGRPQRASEVRAALGRLRAFPTLNIDLIYGQPGQTVKTWLESIRAALDYRPEELYLYPLYVRPGTGIGRHGTVKRGSDSLMRRLYCEGRDVLESAGYEQVSMRFFRLGQASSTSGPNYCCQKDGMLGLGCGARSYTKSVHYSSQFAVEADDVHAILEKWIGQSVADFKTATWGCRLTHDDRQRRYVIQSLLITTGLAECDFRAMYGTGVATRFPLLSKLTEAGLIQHSGGVWRLTALGLEFSDWIGPAFYSSTCRAALERFARP